MTEIVQVEIECGEPITEHLGRVMYGRWASLKIAGVTVFRDLVYDTDRDGNRTEEQAGRNLMFAFRNRIQKVLEVYES